MSLLYGASMYHPPAFIGNPDDLEPGVREESGGGAAAVPQFDRGGTSVVQIAGQRKRPGTVPVRQAERERARPSNMSQQSMGYREETVHER